MPFLPTNFLPDMPAGSISVTSSGKSIERLIYEAIRLVLRTDAGLAAAKVKVWPVDYSDAEQLPHYGFQPNAGDLPVVRLWPMGVSGVHRETEVTHGGNLDLRCQCYAAGADPGDVMDLWGLVREALWPLDVQAAASVRNMLTIALPKGRSLRGRMGAILGTIQSYGKDDYGQFAESRVIIPYEFKTI